MCISRVGLPKVGDHPILKERSFVAIVYGLLQVCSARWDVTYVVAWS